MTYAIQSLIRACEMDGLRQTLCTLQHVSTEVTSHQVALTVRVCVIGPSLRLTAGFATYTDGEETATADTINALRRSLLGADESRELVQIICGDWFEALVKGLLQSTSGLAEASLKLWADTRGFGAWLQLPQDPLFPIVSNQEDIVRRNLLRTLEARLLRREF